MIPLLSRPTCARVGVFHLAAAVIFGCITLDAAQAATSPPVKDTYITLNLPGLVGDFTTVPNAPASSIQVLSLSTGAVAACAQGGIACSVSVNNLSLIKAADSASPKLFQALVTSAPYATAVIYFWQAPPAGTTNYTKTFTIWLTHAILSSFSVGASEGGDSPQESVSLNFATIAFQDNVTGSTACYNVVTKTTANALTC